MVTIPAAVRQAPGTSWAEGCASLRSTSMGASGHPWQGGAELAVALAVALNGSDRNF